MILDRNTSKIAFIISSATRKPKHFPKDKRRRMKQKEKCAWFRPRTSCGSSNIATRTYIYNWHIQARADRVFLIIFSLLFYIFRLCLSATFFSSLSFPLAFTLLLRYRTTWLFFFYRFFFYFFIFFILSCSSVYSLRAFFSFLFLFCSSFLPPLSFATNHTTRYPYFRLFDY